MNIGAVSLMDLATARNRAREILGGVASGQDPADERRADREAGTFAELAKDYIEKHAKQQKRSWEEDYRILYGSEQKKRTGKRPHVPLVKLWGHLTVKAMTRREIRPVFDEIAARAPIMANRTLALVRKMFNFAIEHDWVESSPCHMIKRLAPERQRDRVLSESEAGRCSARRALDCWGRRVEGIISNKRTTGKLLRFARALSPDAPDTVAYEAAQLADTVRRDLVSRRISFCMETVFSDPDGAKVAFLREARSQGYVVFLVFIGLSSGDLAIARVVQRTEAGGHDVPDEKITARFPRTFDNLRQAITFVDHALLFDNSSADEPYRFIAEFAGAKVVRQGSYRCAWAAAAEPEASKLSRAAECDTVSTAENPFVFDWKLGAGDPT